LPKAPSSLAFNSSRDSPPTASLGILCLTTLTAKDFFLISELNQPSDAHGKEFLSSFPVATFRYWKVTVRSPWSPLFHAEQSHLSQSLFIGEVLQPYEHPCGLLWICSNRSMLFLCWGAPELNADLQVGSPKNRAEETLALLAVPFFMQPRI